jgi:hypothetical protein
MGMELLPPQLGVYATLCAGTAFLIVGHRSVYASQKLGLAKSAGLEVPMGGTIGDLNPTDLRVRKGSLTERVLATEARMRRITLVETILSRRAKKAKKPPAG